MTSEIMAPPNRLEDCVSPEWLQRFKLLIIGLYQISAVEPGVCKMPSRGKALK